MGEALDRLREVGERLSDVTRAAGRRLDQPPAGMKTFRWASSWLAYLVLLLMVGWLWTNILASGAGRGCSYWERSRAGCWEHPTTSRTCIGVGRPFGISSAVWCSRR